MNPIVPILIPYLELTALSLLFSLISVVGLRLLSERAYGKRTLMLGTPILGSFLGVVSVSSLCFIHWLSLGQPILDMCHGVCIQAPPLSVHFICTSFVTIALASFSLAISSGLLSYYFGDKLATHLLHAKPLDEETAEEIHEMVRSLSRQAEVRPPQLYYVEGSTPRVFTAGRRSSAVIVMSVGLLETLSKKELEASLAHEISHVKNRDCLIKTLVSSLKLSSPFIFPFYFVEPAIHREREFLADEGSVNLTGKVSPLISALIKIGETRDFKSNRVFLQGFFLSFLTRSHRYGGIFDKHPPLEERLHRLIQLKTYA